MWFNKSAFMDMDNDEDEELDLQQSLLHIKGKYTPLLVYRHIANIFVGL